uniref:Putative mediator of rna polymerase ii transcription subunit 13-like protein n=1 Tax=Nyssomyia neivai TaxID=330878 RepID=A0A1L8DFJ7_9DIPT
MASDSGGGRPPEGQRQKFYYNQNTHYNEFKVVVTKPKDFDSIQVGKIVKNNTNQGDVKETLITGRKSAVIICSNRNVANALAKAKEFEDNGYIAYIPIYYITSCGIIRGINKKYTNEEILQEIDARQVSVYKVERIKRREIVDGEPVYMDTERMKVYFEGNEIPQYVYINSVRFPCDPFVRFVRQCHKCWEYTHISRNCTKALSKCKICGEGHPSNGCANPPKCSSCRGNHPSDYINCPEKARQQNINTAITMNNMSANEAALLFPRPQMKRTSFAIVTQNRFGAFNDDDDVNEEYPTIQESNERKHNKNKNMQRKVPTHPRPSARVQSQWSQERIPTQRGATNETTSEEEDNSERRPKRTTTLKEWRRQRTQEYNDMKKQGQDRLYIKQFIKQS